MLEFPRWKVALVLLVTAFFALATLPDILPERVVEKLPGFLPKDKVPLGLDLRGGSYLLLELDFKAYLRDHMNNLRDGAREVLRKEHIGYLDLHAGEREITLTLRRDTLAEDTNLKAIFRKIDPDLTAEINGDKVRLYYDERTFRTMQSQLLQQSIEIVNRRVNETGTKEPIIQSQGLDRIVVQVPGLQDPGQLKALLGKTAKMTFHLVNESVSATDIARGTVSGDTRILPSDDEGDPANGRGRPTQYAVYSQVALGGELLTDARAAYQDGLPVVEFQFNTLGAQRFGDVTRDNVGKRFAVVLDNKVITAPVIRSAILGGRGIIEGNFSVESANQLAVLLRAGALPAPLTVIEERSVGPSLGQDSIHSGVTAAYIGIGLVIVFMLLSYGLFGLFADVALLVHLIIVLGTMSLIQATLTLPGIAGIVLTMGMAVDANVLIFERIRDELRFGKSPLAAIESGFRLAYGTIIDSNITTLLAAGLLYYFGSGSVKGFAVTLTIGILSTIFASVMFVRMLIIFWIRRTRPKRVPI
jgi:preprotein translocase subunit SecD